MPARHWWDAELAQGSTRRASMVFDPRPGAPAGNVWWSGNSSEANAYLYGYESLWLPASLLRRPGRLADALFEARATTTSALHFNKGLAGAPADKIAAARDTAMNPAVLDAFALAIIATGAPHSNPGLPGHEPDLAKGREADAAAITAAADALRAVVPDAGAYVSESNYFDRSCQKSYWGAELPAPRGRQEEVRPRRPLLRPQRRRQRGVEQGRLREGSEPVVRTKSANQD